MAVTLDETTDTAPGLWAATVRVSRSYLVEHDGRDHEVDLLVIVERRRIPDGTPGGGHERPYLRSVVATGVYDRTADMPVDLGPSDALTWARRVIEAHGDKWLYRGWFEEAMTW
jgi:hypothetical protein